jgi:hypothetical protein
MSKATTSEVYNTRKFKSGELRLSQPRYYAVEISGEPGVFLCPAKGAETWPVDELKSWAQACGCELVLLRWANSEQPAGEQLAFGLVVAHAHAYL